MDDQEGTTFGGMWGADFDHAVELKAKAAQQEPDRDPFNYDEVETPSTHTEPSTIDLNQIVREEQQKEQHNIAYAAQQIQQLKQDAEKYHEWTDFKPLREGKPRGPEFVIDDVIRANIYICGGTRGIGKSSTFVPMALGVCKLIDYPLPISIRRQVIYITEDANQVFDILQAMRQDNVLSASNDEISQWFHVVDSARITPQRIAEVADTFRSLSTPNKRVNGTTFDARPWVIVDTLSANIDLDDGSNNEAVAKAISMINESFGDIPMMLVGHVAKAMNKSSVDNPPTVIGAPNWEAMTQGTVYLVNGNNGDKSRYLKLGKARFEKEISEFEILSHVAEYPGEDFLGNAKVLRGRYNLLKPTTMQDIKHSERERKKEQNLDEHAKLKTEVLAYVREHPNSLKTAIVSNIEGTDSKIRSAIDTLVIEGRLNLISAETGAGKIYSVPCEADEAVPF
jgi:hypothetical protein